MPPSAGTRRRGSGIPGLHEYEGEGGLAWLRSFSGLIVTCGLDHILFMHSQDAAHYHYAHRKTVDSSIHGRVSTIPARLSGYGEVWDGDECTLYCEGIVQQSTVFGEDLHLIRRIEAKVGGNEILLRIAWSITASAARRTCCCTTSMWVIRCWPRAAATWRRSRTRSGPRTPRPTRPRASATGPCPPRSSPFHEQVWEHWLAADSDGQVPVALVNDGFDGGRGLGFVVETRKSEFPCQFQWQNYQAGQYAMGIEPSTNHVLGKPFAAERGELIWLEHGEERSYTTRMAVLDGRATRSPPWSSASGPSPPSRTPTTRSRPDAGTRGA